MAKVRWYYWGLGHRAKETREKAKSVARRHNCRYKVVKTKDVLGGFLYKVYYSKDF